MIWELILLALIILYTISEFLYSRRIKKIKKEILQRQFEIDKQLNDFKRWELRYLKSYVKKGNSKKYSEAIYHHKNNRIMRGKK